MPLVRRALKVLSDREVSPQLGLLKSTLLQLDSTFSERTYGAGSFRDFAQKLAAAGHVVAARVGPERARRARRRRVAGTGDGGGARAASRAAAAAADAPSQPQRDASEAAAGRRRPRRTARRAEPRTADGIREVRRLFQSAQNPPRWPMYIRQAKQFLRNVDASFDERKFGFASLVDLLRACQREGLFRIERDRQGVMRVFPGNIMQAAERTSDGGCRRRRQSRQRGGAGAAESGRVAGAEWTATATSPETEVVDGDVVQEMNAAPPVLDGEATRRDRMREAAPAARRRRKGAQAAAVRGAAKTAPRRRPGPKPRRRGPPQDGGGRRPRKPRKAAGEAACATHARPEGHARRV